MPTSAPSSPHAQLAKLGIDKSDPNELTPAERAAFVRLDIDPGGC